MSLSEWVSCTNKENAETLAFILLTLTLFAVHVLLFPSLLSVLPGVTEWLCSVSHFEFILAKCHMHFQKSSVQLNCRLSLYEWTLSPPVWLEIALANSTWKDCFSNDKTSLFLFFLRPPRMWCRLLIHWLICCDDSTDKRKMCPLKCLLLQIKQKPCF